MALRRVGAAADDAGRAGSAARWRQTDGYERFVIGIAVDLETARAVHDSEFRGQCVHGRRGRGQVHVIGAGIREHHQIALARALG